MTSMIDYGYAANLEELQNVIENLTLAAQAEFDTLNKGKSFDPSIVGFGGMQLKVQLEARALEDDSYDFTMRFHFLSLSERQHGG